MNLKKYRGYPGEPTETNQDDTAQEVARLQAELDAERKKIKDQNSYITKLESERKEVQTQTQPKVETPKSTGTTTQVSAAERYAINAATKEIIQAQEAELKAKYGEDVYNEFKDDFVLIAKSNISDPFNVPQDLFPRVEAMALGRAMTSEEKRVKIAGAFVKPAEQPVVQPQTPQTVVVDPAGKKINTINPDDKQTLGTQTPQNPNQKVRVSRQEFFESLNKNKRNIR